ncbi:uncharacterized protein PAC_01485 [Phialocephala subalpina]|uniref:Uncharacterized protein n=1 Tax=Phialocephala subalpina TaxID=576137 RepID=A0A1L7WFR7_9HELO|nr:uncharacterized protein PAC_01485 [Phialocephala subalpina]
MRGRCDTTMEVLSEDAVPCSFGVPIEQSTTTQRALWYVQHLRSDMEKASKKWKAYQRRREKAGKSGSDWTPPQVVLGRMRPITEVVNPYSYHVDTRASRV